MRYMYVFLLVLLFCLVTYASAQSTDASISGQVVDPSGRVIPDADIQILNEATGIQYGNKTNNSGIYTVAILPPGQYRVQVSKVGFKTLIKPGITLNVQGSIALNFTLPLGATSESITVESGSSLINTTDATVGTVVDQKFVANMPLNGRSFQDLIALAPGVVTQSPQAGSSLGYNGDFSVNGQRTESNYYTVDGVSGNTSSGNGYGQPQNGTGGALGGSTALGTTQSLVSVDALREFRVQTSTYSAEYGRSPGGQFSLVTRSGTNALHGSIFDYFRNDVFDANDWFNDFYGKPTPALRQNDFGGTIGGPIWIPKLYDGRSRSFFFVSYEGLRLTQPTEAAVQYVPDNYLRQQATGALQSVLNAFPIPNGLDYGNASEPSLAQFIAPFSLPSSIDSASLRLDHTVGPKLAVFFRYGYTPSTATSRPSFALVHSNFSSQTFTLGLTGQFSSVLTNEFRLGYDRNDAANVGAIDGFGGASPIDLAAAMGTNVAKTSYPSIELDADNIGSTLLSVPNSSNIGRQWNLVDTLSASMGRHQLKLGVDYRRIKSPLRPPELAAIADYASPQSVTANSADISEITRYVPATPMFTEMAFFVQDECRVTPRLGISMGIRWEVNPAPGEAHGNDAYTLNGSIANPSSLSLAPQGTALWNTTWYNFAPRLGVAWTAKDRVGWETVVRAGGGVFYDNLNQTAASGYSGPGFEAYSFLYGNSLPFTADQLNVPITVQPPYNTVTLYAFPKHLQLPYTLQWNLSLQQSLSKSQNFTVSYVGANGRRLVGAQQLSLTKLNPDFGAVLYYESHLTSSYQALQLQFQRSVSHGIQALASYTWSHSLDFGSTSTTLPLRRGNSDFDVRNNFQTGITWDITQPKSAALANVALGGWGIDGRVMARTAFPVPLQGSPYVDPTTGSTTYTGLNAVVGQPLYLYGPNYPGGKVINHGAFTLPAKGVAGNAPRNNVRGFGGSQINIAVRKDFRIHDAVALQFRAETFNTLNHPNFGRIDPTYSDVQFGQATAMLNQSLATVASQYQQGGPRSMQFALKVKF